MRYSTVCFYARKELFTVEDWNAFSSILSPPALLVQLSTSFYEFLRKKPTKRLSSTSVLKLIGSK